MAETLSWAGVAIGLLSLGLYLWHRRYPGELTFYETNSISLLHDVVGGLDRLGVTLDGLVISKNLVLVRGLLANTGSIDLEPMMIAAPLRVSLDAAGRFADFDVRGRGIDVSARSVDEGSFDITHGLLRKGEAISIEALVELHQKPKDELLRFSHRVARFSTVKRKQLLVQKSSKKRVLVQASAVLATLLVSVVIFASYFIGALPSTAMRAYVGVPHSSQLFDIQPAQGGLISLKGANDGDRHTLDIAGAEKLSGLEILVKSPFGRLSVFLDLVVLCMYPGLAIYMFHSQFGRAMTAKRIQKRYGASFS